MYDKIHKNHIRTNYGWTNRQSSELENIRLGVIIKCIGN